MPDLTYEFFEMCASIDGPLTTTEGGYTQTGMFSERHWPECTCKAYKFSQATINFGGRMVKPECKHIVEAQRKTCGWHGAFSGEAQETPGVCPKCGGPTVKVRVAV